MEDKCQVPVFEIWDQIKRQDQMKKIQLLSFVLISA